MTVVEVTVHFKSEYSSNFSIALVEQLLVALALGRERFKVGNAASFIDLRAYIWTAVKFFLQIKNLCDSNLPFKDLSRRWYFRIILKRSWLHFLSNSLFVSEVLKMLIPLSFLETVQSAIGQFLPAISDKWSWHCTFSLKNSIEWASLPYVCNFHAG